MSNSKVIIHIGGGVMAGVFGAGVFTSLEEENTYPFIEAIYGSSAGAIIGAYFLANQSKLGSSIFYDNLIHDFIIPSYVPLGIYDRAWNKFISPISHGKMRNPIDINYVDNILTQVKKIDINTIKQKNVPFYIHVLNLKQFKSEFIDITNHKDPFRILKASISAAPYYFSEDLEYIDGDIHNCFPITNILEKHPDNKIISVMSIMPDKIIRRSLKAFLEGAVSSLMYSSKIWKTYMLKDFISKQEMKKAKLNPRVTIISPSRDLKIWPNTTNREKLLRIYEAGRQEGKRLALLIKIK